MNNFREIRPGSVLD